MDLDNLIEDKKYKKLIEMQLKGLLDYMFESGTTFNIVCNIRAITFDPEMPNSISSNFKPLTLFAISGYTYESARVEENFLIFEAGFGPASFASEVRVPLFAIMQVVLSENVVFINIIAGNDNYIKEIESKKTNKKSVKSFLSNPKNSDLIKNIKPPK